MGRGMALLVLWACGAAWAVELPPPASRSVAVLEVRNDVAQAQDLAHRLVGALARNTSLQVVDAREGRRRFGMHLEAEVARCAGQPDCLAKIGQRLGVAEVLLLAVSQLGDVVLALQRIDVASRSVAGRVADSMPADQEADEARVLGWLQQLYPPETFKQYGHIRIHTDVSGAHVYLNASPRGQTPLRHPIRVLAPGHYRVLVEKAGYLPFQATLLVMPNTTVEVTASLSPQARSTPWYRRWYVWATLGAGVALAAGGTALGATLSREPPDRTRVPAVIEVR